MKKLFLSVYLTVIASLLVFACLISLSWVIFARDDDQGSPRLLFAGRIAEKMLNDQNQDITKTIEEWADISGYELAIYDRNNLLLAKSPKFIAYPERFVDMSKFYTAKLSDGRSLKIGKSRNALHKFNFFKLLAVLLSIAALVALMLYPAVRHLTGRLERLTKGVALMADQRGVRLEVEGCDECAVLAETFNKTAEKLDNLIFAQKSLLANASHELRSPLARLRLAIESLSPDTPKDLLTEIRLNISELDTLIEEILLASRLEADGIAKVREAVDVGLIVKEEAARFNLTPSIPNDAYILGEGRLIRRLVRNLLENAYKHGTMAEVTLTLNDHLTLDIKDNGEGVKPEESEKIFEAFYRKAGHGEVKGGVGLGLSLCRRIAREHGGEIVCMPSNDGAHFRVTLPL